MPLFCQHIKVKQLFQNAFLALWVLCLSLSASGQTTSPATVTNDESKADSILSVAKSSITTSAKKSRARFEAEKNRLRQAEVLQQLDGVMQSANNFLKQDLDTNTIIRNLNLLTERFTIAGDGIFTHTGTAQTYRNLTTSSKLIGELSVNVLKVRATINNHLRRLTDFKYHLDSLYSDSSIYTYLDDAELLGTNVARITKTVGAAEVLDSLLQSAILRNQQYLLQVDAFITKLNVNQALIGIHQRQLSHNIFQRDFANLWESPKYSRPFRELVNMSLIKNWLALGFYVPHHTFSLLLTLFAFWGLFKFLKSIKANLIAISAYQKDAPDHLVLKYPAWSALLCVSSVFQFIFPQQPFVFSVMLWLGAAIALTVIFKDFISAYWLKVWVTLLALFVIASGINLLLQASRPERWAILLVAASGVVISLLVLRSKNTRELRQRAILIFITILFVLELFSFLTNLLGRYNLAKSLMIAGYMNVIIGITFLWLVNLINGILALSAICYRDNISNPFILNFEKIGTRVPPIFYFLLVVGWTVLIGRNFYAFQQLTVPITEFIYKERYVGEIQFRYSNIFEFFLIIAATIIISRVISFFVSDRWEQEQSSSGWSNFNFSSWLLLIRVTIMGFGLLVAFAATGIPLERITFILGALSVGIGLGLQGLVSNSLSGLIMAFEKPVKVGDIVQVDNHSGKIKEIGFRSSVLTTWDGAFVTIPNSDLLNAQLVNWTTNKNAKRVSLVIGVSTDTQLDPVCALILALLKEDPRILPIPQPVVMASEILPAAINLQVFFWVRSFGEMSQVKSDVINKVVSQFKESGVRMASHHQDLHITYSDADVPLTLNTKGT